MLVPNQYYQVRWHYKNKEYYENKGYKFTKFGDFFEVKAEDLYAETHQEVEVQCDVCGKIMRRSFRLYLREHDAEFGDTCMKCDKEKKIRTNKKKFGTEWALQTEDSKQKQKETCLERFGVEYVSQDKDFRNRVIQTCIDKYGVDNISKVPEIREKATNSFYTNGTCPTSRPQIELNEILKNLYGNSELNYPCGKYSLDSMIVVNGQKIDVEYDGIYWHNLKKDKDQKRNEYVLSQGYKILRFVSHKELPSIDTLQKCIDALVTTSETLMIIDIM